MQIYKDLSIGQRFKKIRLDKGISQEKLAEGICSNSVVSHIETDRQYPSAHIWGKLADRLGVPVYEIMGEKEKQMETSFQLDMIRVYIEKGDYVHALDLINELEKNEILEHQRVTLLIYRGECCVKSGMYAEAVGLLLPFVEQQEIQQTISNEMLCETFSKLGTAHYCLSDFEKAYSAFEQGYRVSLKLTEFGLIAARVTRNLGMTCNYLGYKEDARRYLAKAQAFFERVSDLKELANTSYDMALATGNAEYMVKAYSLFEGLNLVREANLAKQYHAFHVESRRDYNTALKELDSCSDEFAKLGDNWMCVYTLSRAAIVCVEHGDLSRAEQYIASAGKIKEGQLEPNDYLSIDYHMALATYHLRKGHYNESIVESQNASYLCDKMGLNEESAKALELTAEAYELQGIHDLAYQVSKKVISRLKKNKEE